MSGLHYLLPAFKWIAHLTSRLMENKCISVTSSCDSRYGMTCGVYWQDRGSSSWPLMCNTAEGVFFGINNMVDASSGRCSRWSSVAAPTTIALSLSELFQGLGSCHWSTFVLLLKDPVGAKCCHDTVFFHLSLYWIWRYFGLVCRSWTS